MATNSVNLSGSTKRFYFCDQVRITSLLDSVKHHQEEQVLTLEQCLESIFSRFNGLQEMLQTAQNKCQYPTNHGLSRDESAAIYLYTMNYNGCTLHSMINEHVHSNKESISKCWLNYLILFNRALHKLPNVETTVWQVIEDDKIEDFKDRNQIIRNDIVSCSSSIEFINSLRKTNSKLLSIKTKMGKNISNYSCVQNQYEIILLPGTQLQFVKTIQDSTSTVDVFHFIELTDETPLLQASYVTRILVTERYKIWFFLPVMHGIIVLLALFLFTSFGQQLIPPPLSDITKALSDLENNVNSFVNNLTTTNYSESSPLIHVHIDERGNRYEGEWKDGKKHGKGKMDYANGYKYVGDWFEDTATGVGITNWPNGDKYEGQYQYGQRHGRGTYTHANGDVYIGDWFQDKKSGRGSFTWGPNGSWANDTYEGDFLDDQMHGQGTYSLANGEKYVGGWINNKHDGQGTYSFFGGDRFEGSFKDGKRHGPGTYYFMNGNKFVGDWVDGEQVNDHGAITWSPRKRPPMMYSNLFNTHFHNDITL